MRLLFILLLCSCSSTSFKDFFSSSENSNKRNEELMKDFKVNEKVLKKFEVKELSSDEVSEESEKSVSRVDLENNEKIKTVPKEESKKVVRKLVPKKPVTSNKRIEQTKIASEKIVKTSRQYPKDYPAEFKKQDKISEKFWDEYKPFLFENEKMVLDIKYLGISTGTIVIETKPSTLLGSEPVYHLQTRVKTSRYYSYLYEIDDLCDSYVSKKSFIPLKFSLIQRESAQNIDDLQLFDQSNYTTYSFYKRETKEKTKKSKKSKTIPYFYQDPFSVLYFVRGLPMTVGAKYEIPIVNQGKIEHLKVTVIGTESLSTKIGDVETYKVDLETKYKGDTIKGGHMTFWFTADERRIFVKFDAKIKIGNVEGVISEYK